MSLRPRDPAVPERRRRGSPLTVVVGGMLHAGLAFLLAPGLVLTYAYGPMGLSSWDQLAWLRGAPALTAVAAWFPVMFSVLTAGALSGDLWRVPGVGAVVDRAWMVYFIGASVSVAGAVISLAFYARPVIFGG